MIACTAKRHVIFDVHGVLLGLGQLAQTAAQRTVEQLRAAGFPLRFVTNSSSVGRSKLVQDLACVGIAADEAEVFTAATTVATFLGSGAKVLRVFVVGSPSLRNEIAHVCGSLVQWCTPEEAEVIVVSRDPSLDGHVLERIAANKHGQIVATCRDAHFADALGLHAGPGDSVVAVEQATRRSALVIGKPNPYVLTDVMKLNCEELHRSFIVGDSLMQDVMLAVNARATSVLLTCTGDSIDNAFLPRPNFVIREISELLSVMKEYA